MNYKLHIIGGNKMTDKEAIEISELIIKQVVDCLSEKRYDYMEHYADFENGWTAEDMEKFIEGCLELNELSHIDKYDVPCNFNPKYEYHQLKVYVYNNGKGFATDYDLTTDSEINDFTLQMEFLFTDKGIKAYILDVHIL